MINKQLSILHVEDDAVDAVVVERSLKKSKVNSVLYLARNGIEALDMLRGTGGKEKITPSPQIVLLDLNMPKMNGIEFIKELRADKDLRSISVFVITTSNNTDDRVEAYDLNVAGYIIKPLLIEDYNNIIATLNDFWILSEFGA